MNAAFSVISFLLSASLQEEISYPSFSISLSILLFLLLLSLFYSLILAIFVILLILNITKKIFLGKVDVQNSLEIRYLV